VIFVTCLLPGSSTAHTYPIVNYSKWDHDWAIYDLPCEHWDWKDMTDEQKDAAMHFGYSRALWDETDEDDDAEFGGMAASVKPPKMSSSQPQQEKKEEEAAYESEDSEDEAAAPASSKPAKKSSDKTKKKIIVSKAFGGSGGGDFDHMNNRKITEITVWADDHCVNSLAVKYVGSVKKAGDRTSGEEKTLKLQKGEYIDTVIVRSNNLVQCLTFKTNKGATLGPCGGKGWPKARFGKDHEGKEETLRAPQGGYMLCGIMGGAGVHLDRIAFRWGPIPSSMQS